MQSKWIKRENAPDLVMSVMIWSLATVLITRFVLQSLGWPTISFGVWHIAHVLWGGFFMLGGILILLANHGDRARRDAAAISGVGWGLFIDEVGKYLTKNNDYWFQPAIIFIYISFIMLFLVYRYLEKNKPQDTKTLLYSVISELEEIAEGDLEFKEKINILKKLNKIIKLEKDEDKKNFAIGLKGFVEKIKAKEDAKNKWKDFFVKMNYISYNRIFKKKPVLTVLGIYSAYWAADKVTDMARILANPQKIALIQKFYDDYSLINKTDIYMIGLKLGFDLLAALFFLMGLYNIATRKKFKGIKFFQIGLLVSIFFSSVFKFYFEQFSGIFGLAMNVAVLVGISKLKHEITK